MERWHPDAGKSLEDAYERLNPDATRLPPESKVFDFIWEKLQKAVSIKTMNILSVTYIRNPQQIYSVLKNYVDKVADYNKPRTGYDLFPENIKSREIQLAIPEGASPVQIRYLTQAWSYARSRGVNLEITSIRE